MRQQILELLANVHTFFQALKNFFCFPTLPLSFDTAGDERKGGKNSNEVCVCIVSTRHLRVLEQCIVTLAFQAAQNSVSCFTCLGEDAQK